MRLIRRGRGRWAQDGGMGQQKAVKGPERENVSQPRHGAMTPPVMCTHGSAHGHEGYVLMGTLMMAPSGAMRVPS